MQVNTTEKALVALNNDMAAKNKELEDLDDWKAEELDKCKKKKDEYIEMYKKLSAEMEEMKQIASPGVAMDVKTGKVITTEGAVGLLQKQSYPSAKDMKELKFLLKGTQTAAKQFLQCVALNSGHKERMSQLQKFVAVDSFGDSEVGDTEDLVNATEALDPKPNMVEDPGSDGKKCKYEPGKPKDGNLRTFKLKGAGATEDACTKKCAEDPECFFLSAIWGQWCIGCKEELTHGHKGAKAFKKVFGDDSDSPLEISEPTKPATGGPDPEPIGKYNCKTRETWSKEKKRWCCKKENIGCKYNCRTRESWSDEKKKWCCKNKGLGCAVIKPITINPKPIKPIPTEKHPDPYPEPQVALPKPVIKPISIDIPAKELPKEKHVDPYPEPQVALPKPAIKIGSLSDEDGVKGGSANAAGAAAAGEGDSTTDKLTIDDAERDENDQAAMDAAEAIKTGAATPEECEAEKKILEETYVKTYVELSRLKDEYNELANSTACEDNVESLYKSKKTPIDEKIDELIKDIDAKVDEIESLRPRLESATKSEKELRKHIATLTEECAQLPETVSNLDKVRDAIEALSKCPGLSRIQFSLPKWIGTWVVFKLKAKEMTDEDQDKAMNAACAEAAEGTRAAEVGEIAEQTVEGIPEANTADLPVIGTCPHCQGDEATDFPSGHKRICWKQGNEFSSKAKSTNCAVGKKALLCVSDRENIRQIPGQS